MTNSTETNESRHIQPMSEAGNRYVSLLTDDQTNLALEMIAMNVPDKLVAKRLGVTANYFRERARHDPKFGARYETANIDRVHAKLDDAEERLIDKDMAAELMKHAQWMATKLDRRNFGEKIQHEVATIVINVDKNYGDWEGE